MKRKIIVFLSCMLVIACALIVFRQQIVSYGTHRFLTKILGKDFSSAEITSSNGRISIENFSYRHDRMDMTLERATFSIDFREVLAHPSTLFQLYRKPSMHWSSYLAAMKQYGVNLDAKQGVLNLDDKVYYFSVTGGEKKHEIGSLNVFLDRDYATLPFLEAQFHMRGDQLISQLRIDEVESERFFHLGAFACPKHLQGYTGAKGTVQLHASVIFERDGQIDEISTRFKSSDLSVSIPNMQLQFGLQNFQGELNYPEGVEDAGLPMWKRMDCNLTLVDGWVRLGEDFNLNDLSGTLGLDPRVDPVLQLTGKLDSDGKALAMNLQGKGAIHEDHAYWLEFDLNLDDRKGTLCDAFLSICRPDSDSHVIQLEASGLLPTQVEMLKDYFARVMPRVKDWTIHEGVFGGKLVALFEQGTLSHFEIQDLLCENVSLFRGDSSFDFSKISGEGRLFKQLNLSFSMPTSHFFGLISDPFRSVYEDYLTKEHVQIDTTLDFSPHSVKTAASAHFPSLQEEIHFGYTSPIAFPSSLDEIQNGWVRSQRISHELYGPLVRMGNEDLKIFGDVDLVGTYDGLVMEFSLQVDDFLAKHPHIDFKADQIGEKEQTVGRIRIEYVPETNALSGTVPLRGASAYERSLGLVVEDLTARLHFANGTCRFDADDGIVTFDGKQLLSQIQGEFQLDGGGSIRNAKGTLPFASERTFAVALDAWTPQMCKLRLLDGVEDICELELTNEESWRGVCRSDLLNNPLDLVFSWDLLTNHCKLTATNDLLQFSGRKEEGNYIVDQLETKDMVWSGIFTPIATGFDLQRLRFQKGELCFEATGGFQIDIPQKESPLSIRGELELQGDREGEAPLHFATTRPFKCACMPMLGFILSDVSLSSGESLVEWNHLEHFFSQRKTAVNQAHFHLTQALCDQLMPKILGDFQLENGLTGLAHFDSKDSANHLIASVQTPIGPVKAEMTWEKNAGTLSLGDQEKLTFKMHLGEDKTLKFDAISGKLGRLKANLKQGSAGRLKGTLDLNFSLFSDIFDLPINHYIETWKAGGNYCFDGIFTPADQLAQWAFNGKVKGRDIECMGLPIRSLEAKVEIEEGQIAIEDLDVTDDAGKAWISEGAIMRSGEDWTFSFPLVEIRSFQPISSLTIKRASLEDVKGRFDDPKSISASGSLTFTNHSKNGETALLKHLPIRKGLDRNLFVPASGKVEYVVQGGRVYLRTIANVISAKGRSGFISPRNGVMGFIDFDGNIHIDLQMQQQVNRSSAASIGMQIRGNFPEPEITLR